ncbi:MAG: hypothetical protein QNJ30_15680 [Kiloniellales bacterium]|nr:hypothetical protein [Kiloniellales bacterium]
MFKKREAGQRKLVELWFFRAADHVAAVGNVGEVECLGIVDREKDLGLVAGDDFGERLRIQA